MKRVQIVIIVLAVVILAIGLWCQKSGVFPPASSSLEVGDQQGELNGVAIYYNGDSGVSSGRNLTDDGYNLGLKYQCVEFVKRYYFERLGHRMPDSWGHAKDFFDPSLVDGELNETRGLLQFKNGGGSMPKPDDLIILGPSETNSYGHVAIVSKVSSSGGEIEIAQQNSGVHGKPRVSIRLKQEGGGWMVDHPRVLGWLRMR